MSNHNGWLARDNIAALERVEVVRVTPVTPARTVAQAYEDALVEADNAHACKLHADERYAKARTELARAKSAFDNEASGRMARHFRH